MSKSRALITGCTGQDGSYLAEFLLKKGYKVYGMERRHSTAHQENIKGIIDHPNFETIYGDMTDAVSLSMVLIATQPEEIYNLAAQSFVHLSWTQPWLTNQVNYLGFINLLEAMKKQVPDSKIYQASSSEMFGNQPAPQDEETQMTPRSPYGVSKLASHRIARVYRESFDMFIACGICFNHECISAKTPLLVRLDGEIDVLSASEIAPYSEKRKGKSSIGFSVNGKEVWDGLKWAKIKAITATHRKESDFNHRIIRIQTRSGVIETTAHHNMITKEGIIKRSDKCRVGEEMMVSSSWPEAPSLTIASDEMAEFLGLMVADGYVAKDGSGAKYTKNDNEMRSQLSSLWSRLFVGKTREWGGTSGFGDSRVCQLSLHGNVPANKYIRSQIYDKEGFKIVPRLILNASERIQKIFFNAYYRGDGTKAGNMECITTNSPKLMLGLLYLARRIASIYFDRTIADKPFYRANLLKDPSHPRVKERGEILNIDDGEDCNWVFDLETDSSQFMAGIGTVIIKNSPRRGIEFVTRKIARAAAQFAKGIRTADKPLSLGNIEAYRDWGYAPDYVEAMWLMLQQDHPNDYVLATGEKHSVGEFLDAAFEQVDVRIPGHVCIGEAEHMRPAEVHDLLGDASKAKGKLGWQPKTSFKQLVEIMVNAELEK